MCVHALPRSCHDDCCSTIDNSLMSNIQKLFSERIEIFTTVEFSKVSVLTGIIKISLKVIVIIFYNIIYFSIFYNIIFFV